MPTEKSTDELFSEIKESNELRSFLAKNAANIQYPTIANYLESLLKEKQMDKSTLINKSGLDRVYIYQILSGKKTAPSRKKLIGLALTLELTLDETQHLLKYGHENILYPRDPEDSILIYAINKHKSVDETNRLLYDLDFDCIT